jgi:hypothetical protein
MRTSLEFSRSSPALEVRPPPAFGLNMRQLAAFIGTFIASSVVTNETSYLFLLPLLVALYYRSPLRFNLFHLLFVITTVMLAIYGSVLGLQNGNITGYIIRFAAPLLVLAAFLPCSNLGIAFYESRRDINFIAFFFTLFAFVLTFFSFNDLSLWFLQGWSLGFSTRSAVGVWHYFALPFAGAAIFEYLYVRQSRHTFLHALLGSATLALLWLTTDTSAFKLACLIMLVFLFIPSRRMLLLARGLPYLLVLLVVDYATVQAVIPHIMALLVGVVSDDGDLIRLVQLQYFVNSINFVGHGFGVAHDFAFADQQRQLSHQNFPYASELPYLNFIHGGGVIAAIWIAFIVMTVSGLLRNFFRVAHPADRLFAFFNFAFSLILVGSIANPFLFSPISMLSIAICLNSLRLLDRKKPSRTELASN